MPIVPEDREDILRKVAFAHVATIGPSGEPQVNPVWFDWDGELLRFSQTTTRQKYRNLQRDSHIAVSIQDPDNPYRYIELRGELENAEDDEGNAFLNRMAKKYIDQDTYPWAAPGEHRLVLAVRPRHTTKQ